MEMADIAEASESDYSLDQDEQASMCVDYTTAEARSQLAKMVMRLFDHWQIGTATKSALLGMNPQRKSSLERYKEGKPLTYSPDLLERVGHLMAIHTSLRILFPYDRDLVYKWVSTQNKAFDGMTPIEYMTEFRFAGLLKVRTYLEVARSH